uniref:Chitin-binding type-2 domain-containing protein n=1 Tax=Anopheles atroparvus TaxID=41427 RepID=A0AAG5DC21_ANOAO
MPTTLGINQPEYNLTTALSEGLIGRYIMMDRLLNNYTRSRSSSASSKEFESSGDGNVEQSGAQGDITEYSYTYLRPTKEAAKIVGNIDSSLLQPLDRLSLDDLNNMLAKTTQLKCKQSDENGVKDVHDLGTLLLPPDGKIHPEHLTQIINQQKQLNLIAAERKQHDDPTGGAGDHSPFTNQAVFMQKPIHVPSMTSTVGPPTDQQQHGSAIVNSFIAKEPYDSDDIIRSIQQISQQMIVNQKPPTKDSTPLLKFTLSPFMKNGHITKTSSIFSANPIGITLTNHQNLDQSMVFDNLKKSPVNEPSSYSATENNFFESYSNRPVQKEIDQSINPVTSSSSESLKDAHTSPTISQFVLAYTLPQPTLSFTGETMTYSRPKHPLFTQLLNDAINRNGASDQMEKLDTTFYKSGFKYHSNSDLSVKNTDTFDDISADGDPNETNTQFKRKLFTLGNTIVKRNQHEESILPLIDAQPDVVRISIATCTLGGREPNKTDCFKYYVCNRPNGAFQSFTCPSFTAFNKKTRLCDTASYQSCRAQQAPKSTALHSLIINNPPSSKTKFNHLPNELLTTQTYFEFINQEADKQNTQYLSHAEKMTMPHSLKVKGSNMSKPPVKIRRKSSTGKKKNSQLTSSTTSTTSAPKRQKVASKVSRCRFEGRMPDSSNQQHYYVCTYRKNDKKFVKMKMTCPAKLTYCPSLQFCTVPFDCFS